MQNVKTNKIKILDCTLRDGGYYNQWDFNLSVVNKYLYEAKKSLIDIIELGFRMPKQKYFLGPFAYTTDIFLNKINLPTSIEYAVMINGSDFIKDEKNINNLFNYKKFSPISIVRIAIKFEDAKKTRKITNELKNLGYKVCLNLMQSHGKKLSDFKLICKIIKSWKSVDILYFADSLGNMSPNEVKSITLILKKYWRKNIGFHAHNNKNLALINSIESINNGINLCDSTITGMGRGAGNTSTENLLLELQQTNKHNGNAFELSSTVESFTKIKKKYSWGTNLYYHFAANNNIHPTYVQMLLADNRYGNIKILHSLKYLAKNKSSSYDQETHQKSIYTNKNNIKGKWNASSWLKNKEVLLVGAGDSIKKYKNKILNYINKFKPIVIFLNINAYIPHQLASAVIVSNDARALLDAQHYKDIKCPIILPLASLRHLIGEKINNLKIYDYGLVLENDSFDIKSNGCRIQWPLAAPYAFSIITRAKAKKISLIGFDGYLKTDPKHSEMNDVFEKYFSLNNSIPIVTLTPSIYNIKKNEIFNNHSS